MSVSAILNNPNFAKIINDAIKSPPGSSIREKASAMLKLSRNRNNGQGGYSPYMRNDGQGGSPYNPTGTMAPSEVLKYGLGPIRPELMSKAVAELPQGQTNAQATPQAGYVDPYNPESVMTIFPSAPKRKTTPTPTLPDQTTATSTDTTTPTPELPEGVMGSSDDFYDNWFAGLSADQKIKYQPFLESVKAGLGAKTTALQIMNDADKLSKVSGLPANLLPSAGASLSGTVNDLEDSLKEEYKIDSLKDNLTKLQERGMDITSNLKGYMTTRDKYIEKIDKMIDTAKDFLPTR